MDIKNEVLYRVYFIFFGLVLPVASLLIYRTIQISIVEGERWRHEGRKLYIQYRPIEAERGNILAANGELLATSIPYFDLYMDPNSTGMSDDVFLENLDSLAWCLATYVDPSYTPGGYREYLLQKREDGARYINIKRKVSYAEKQFIEKFPLFREGQMRGGFIAEKKSERKRPFGLLAQRSVGYIREGAKPVGLEGYFNEVLGGEEGKQPMILVDRSNDIWVPLEDLSSIQPRSGSDIVTTIDIDLQDIVEQALMRAMNYHKAKWGTAILMEVETGAIRAIANLSETQSGYWETYNHAIGTAIEPGSTWKLASIMALLEDNYITLQDSVDIERGETQFYEETLKDASPASRKLDSISIRQAFEISSNVAMAKLVDSFYNVESTGKTGGPFLYIDRLKQFGLHLPTGIEIEGEANPYIKEAYSEEDNWSGTTLPWMSIGYELQVTPLQLLTFYNAVANDGRVMKPYLVSEILRNGEIEERFRPTALRRQIASKQSIELAQELLKGVVARGTAYKLQSERYDFAGKTGTAQINYRRTSVSRRVGGYQASFVGYFPAQNPKYSCIIVINDPERGGIYGSDVAGPVFREIADQVYTRTLDLHPSIDEYPLPVLAGNELPAYDAGHVEDIQALTKKMNLEFFGQPDSEIGVLIPKEDSLTLVSRTIIRGRVPNVIGLGVRDAVYVLENLGLNVKTSGFGRVVRQSIKPGTRVQGQTIWIRLG